MNDKTEAQQREIAERMGISWEAYARRAATGVSIFRQEGYWSPRWYLRFGWRPRDPEFVATNNGDDPYAAKAEAFDLAHNQAILAAIPKTEPVVPDDVLSVAVRKYGHEGMSVAFLSPFRIETERTMRGYVPVFDEDGKPVLVDGGLMMCEKPNEKVEAQARYMAVAQDRTLDEAMDGPKWSARGGPGDGDIARLAWGAFGWRGILALYRFTRNDESKKKCRGIELMTQRRGREPNSRVVGFYRRRA